jgi:hypothetical protein
MFASDEVIAQKLRPLFDQAAVRGVKIPEVVLGLKEAGPIRDAIAHVNKWLFDYSNLHPVERNIIRRIVPFWTFLKNTHLLMLRLPVDRPLLSRAFRQVGDLHRDKLAHAAINAIDDESLPDWLEGHVPMGYDKEGNFIFASIKGLNPFNSFGSLAKPRQLVASTNPLIKVTLEYFGGRDMWGKKDLQTNEPIFDYTGRVYRVRNEGGKVSLVRDVPGESFISQFASQYPQVKLARQLTQPTVTDSNGKPVTTPFMDEHGNWDYPTNVLDTALRFAGISLKRVKPDELAQREVKLRVDFIKKMANQLKFAPPEYRDFIIESIRRAGSNQFEAEGY